MHSTQGLHLRGRLVTAALRVLLAGAVAASVSMTTASAEDKAGSNPIGGDFKTKTTASADVTVYIVKAFRYPIIID